MPCIQIGIRVRTQVCWHPPHSLTFQSCHRLENRVRSGCRLFRDTHGGLAPPRRKKSHEKTSTSVNARRDNLLPFGNRAWLPSATHKSNLTLHPCSLVLKRSPARPYRPASGLKPHKRSARLAKGFVNSRRIMSPCSEHTAVVRSVAVSRLG